MDFIFATHKLRKDDVQDANIALATTHINMIFLQNSTFSENISWALGRSYYRLNFDAEIELNILHLENETS